MGQVTIKVKDIEGKEHLFVVEHDEPKSIVEIAAEQGVELPYSCCSGACFTCCAEVKKGKEFLEQDKVGEKLIDTEENEFLCCIGWIDSACFESEDDAEVELELLN